MTERRRYYLLSLGCAKNTVDSEGMGQLLGRAGYAGTADPAEADLLVVNTCGFISPARDESMDALRQLAAIKRPGQRLVAAGCLAQLAGAELFRQIPGLDGVLGTRRWMDVDVFADRLGRHRPLVHLPAEADTVGLDERGVIRASVQGASAYLKIADGCRRPCAFCAIPAIKGTAVSRATEQIVADAVHLAARGVHEIILIAQDTSDYGRDLGMRDGLATLLDRLVAAVPDLPWIRIMYAYPGYVTPRLIETMARHPQILPYLDIPLQHAHPATLRRMRRPANVDSVRSTIAALRRRMPDIAIRTTFIVGYPGETEDEFRALLDLVDEMAFDRVGAFTYWPEPGTPAAALPDQLADEVKSERYDRLMLRQQAISLACNRAQIGRTLDVLIEEHRDGDGIGRSYRDAPEIDGVVRVEGDWPMGEILPVRITAATHYDLIGTVQAPA
jgi:ribosomal protein S12 methylthiotransferase